KKFTTLRDKYLSLKSQARQLGLENMISNDSAGRRPRQSPSKLGFVNGNGNGNGNGGSSSGVANGSHEPSTLPVMRSQDEDDFCNAKGVPSNRASVEPSEPEPEAEEEEAEAVITDIESDIGEKDRDNSDISRNSPHDSVLLLLFLWLLICVNRLKETLLRTQHTSLRLLSFVESLPPIPDDKDDDIDSVTKARKVDMDMDMDMDIDVDVDKSERDDNNNNDNNNVTKIIDIGMGKLGKQRSRSLSPSKEKAIGKRGTASAVATTMMTL
ncbi:hypothetical protein RFI_36920, partial [Reticulomyxa filosa]